MGWKQMMTGAAVVASVAMIGGTAFAQSSAAGQSGTSGVQGQGGTTGSQGQGGTTDVQGQGAARHDRDRGSSDQDKFYKKAAEANLAEVQLAQLGVQKAQNPQVKQFAQMMVDAHQRALDELKQAAGSDATLPTTLDEKHQKKQDKLSKLNGQEFDREFMDAMVDAHKSMEHMLADNVGGREQTPGWDTAPGTGGTTTAGGSGTTGTSGGTTAGQPTGGEPGGTATAGSGSGGTMSGAGTGAAGTSVRTASPKLSGPAYQWASKSLQEVRSHLEQAKEIQDQIKK